MAALRQAASPSSHWHWWSCNDTASRWESWGGLKKSYQENSPRKIKFFVSCYFFFLTIFTPVAIWMPVLMKKSVQDCANDSRDGGKYSKKLVIRLWTRLSWNSILTFVVQVCIHCLLQCRDVHSSSLKIYIGNLFTPCRHISRAIYLIRNQVLCMLQPDGRARNTSRYSENQTSNLLWKTDLGSVEILCLAFVQSH